MTMEEFIKVLEESGYLYKEQGGKLAIFSTDGFWLNHLQSIPPDVVFLNQGDVALNSLETLPPGVEFRNDGYVGLKALKSLSSDVVFRNGGRIFLHSIKTLPSGVQFMNRGHVDLELLQILPPGVEFKNGGDVNLSSLVGTWFEHWKDNIGGANSQRLLNVMIKQGVFI